MEMFLSVDPHNLYLKVGANVPRYGQVINFENVVTTL